MHGQDESVQPLPKGSAAKLVMAGVFAIVGPGLAIFAFVAAGDAVSDSAANWTRVAGVAFGALFVFLAYVLVRQVFPPKAHSLTIALSSHEVRRGGTIDARLEIAQAAQGDGEIDFGLVCTEYYDVEKTHYDPNGYDARHRHTEDAIAYQDWRTVSPSQGVHSFRFDVPADQPFSFRGDCLSFEWRVSARDPKRLRFDRATNVSVKVLP
jgi:hypothetical protein